MAQGHVVIATSDGTCWGLEDGGMEAEGGGDWLKGLAERGGEEEEGGERPAPGSWAYTIFTGRCFSIIRSFDMSCYFNIYQYISLWNTMYVT